MNESTTEIRQKFLDFFRRKGHQIVASSSLLLDHDPTLLFTNAGMNQFKDVFLGLDKRNYSRATTSQRCVRVGGKHSDLENVGYTACHHTFFEMLGNFSFGDYFKYEAIQYAWEILTSKEWFNLSKDRFWITVYKYDKETYKIWRKEIGIPHEKIILIGDKEGVPYNSDNFWKMGNTGPCGPCTEIFYDHGDHIRGGPPGSNKENGDRYIEIWNIVFMEFNRQDDGTMELLPKPSVDTGMGLERITAVLQHVNSNYDIDLFRSLIKEIANIITNITDLNNKSLRIIADHIRSCAFLIVDGVIPSNENYGYVLRRIIRRAIFHGNMLGAKSTFLYKLINPLIEVMKESGEDLKQQKIKVEQVLKIEEEQFSRTLERGLAIFSKEIKRINGNTLDGETAFRLYDTYGFPIDLTIDLCRERNIKIDEFRFKNLMGKQRSLARESSNFTINYNNIIRVKNESEFYGYDHLILDNSNIVALFINGKAVSAIHGRQKEEVVVILDKTPFYAESGGQIGDIGELKSYNFNFIVDNTKKYGRAIGHLGNLVGSMKIGDSVQAVVNKDFRKCIQLNHSATHLLHAALRKVIGEHVVQKGSLVNNKILRFDFSHFKAMKDEEIYMVEDIVNAQIRRNLLIETTIMDLEKAKIKGAMALFNNKYRERVRVLIIGDFSIEICMGTHTPRTGDIGLFQIISESGLAAGIRRIEAVTGESAITRLHAQKNQLCNISRLLKSDSHNLDNRICNILEHSRKMERELKHLRKWIATKESEILFMKAIDIKGIKLLVHRLIDIEPKILRIMVDILRNKYNSIVVVLALVNKNKIFLIAGVSNDMTDQVKAEELISLVSKQIDGKGGGYHDIAQANGKNIAALPSALASIENWVKEKLQK